MLTDRNQGVFRSSFLVLTMTDHLISLYLPRIFIFAIECSNLNETSCWKKPQQLFLFIYILYIYTIYVDNIYILIVRNPCLCIGKSSTLGCWALSRFPSGTAIFRCGILRSKMVTISRHQSIAFSCLICLFDVFRPTSVAPISSKMRTFFYSTPSP